MATSQVKYTDAALSDVVDAALNLQSRVARIKNEMDAIVGQPPDYTLLEPPFNLAAGTGQTLYNYVAAFLQNMNTTCLDLPKLDKAI